MDGYLGEFPVDVAQTEFRDYTAADWALFFIGRYGQFEGAHHKARTLDKAARILNGTPVIITEARWESGLKEYRFVLGEPSEAYVAWVAKMRGEPDEDGEFPYDYDDGD
jgi:hypothetical protein